MKNFRTFSLILVLFLLFFIAGAVSGFSTAQAKEDTFYKNKTMRILVCCSPGGFYDRWARLLARYMGNYIPGNPDIIVQNMPGAGGLIATNYVYNVAKKDGLAIVMPLGSTYLDQVSGRKEVRFDWTKLQWLGTQEESSYVLYARADAPYNNIDDILKAKKPPKCGSSGTGSAGYIVPKVMEKTLGVKFKIILGYPGGSEVDVSVERGEISCRALTVPPHFGREPFISWHKRGFDKHIVQTGRTRDKRLLKTATIWELMDKYKTADLDRRMAKVILSSGAFGRPFAVAPGVPANRVKILRTAYAKSLKDPKLLSEAKRGKMDVKPSTGKQVQALANEVINQPPEVIKGVLKILGR